jgi:hypothetical protein
MYMKSRLALKRVVDESSKWMKVECQSVAVPLDGCGKKRRLRRMAEESKKKQNARGKRQEAKEN